VKKIDLQIGFAAGLQIDLRKVDLGQIKKNGRVKLGTISGMFTPTGDCNE
jgi:hypothetical protein